MARRKWEDLMNDEGRAYGDNWASAFVGGQDAETLAPFAKDSPTVVFVALRGILEAMEGELAGYRCRQCWYEIAEIESEGN
jgi:hypothetical protein